MSTIPEALLAIADEVVRIELSRIVPPKPCTLCRPDDPCAWHRPAGSQGLRLEGGESKV